MAVARLQLGKRSWPYQARVMKMLDTMSRAMRGALEARRVSYEMNTSRHDGFLVEAEKGIVEAEGRYAGSREKAPAK